MRISDWSSDVCSSDLAARLRPGSVRVQSSLDVALQAPAEAFLRVRLRDLARDGAGQGAVLVVDLDGNRVRAYASADHAPPHGVGIDAVQTPRQRSEDRRVGKEGVRTCRSRWSPEHKQKKKKKN